MSDPEVRLVFPGWASEDSIMKSFEAGSSLPDIDTDDYQICEFSEHRRECRGTDLYWSELACQCLHLMANYECEFECDNNMMFDPSQECECVDAEFVDDLF